MSEIDVDASSIGISCSRSYGGTTSSSVSSNGRGGWSISKSVFSTLPDRHHVGHHQRTGDSSRNNSRSIRKGMYDDNNNDEWSIFSGSSSYSPGKVSRSSSVASRNSTMSSHASSSVVSVSSTSWKDSSFKLPKRYCSATLAREIDDDSIDSLLSFERRRGRGGGGVHGDASSLDDNEDDASSGSFLGYSRKEEQVPIDFDDTLSHLESLGFGGINVIDDNNVDTFSSNKKTSLLRGDDMDGDTDDPLSTAWWIKDLKGWFQYDTTTVYSNKKITYMRQSMGATVVMDGGEVVAADAYDLHNKGMTDDNVQERTASGTIVRGSDSQQQSYHDDHSDTSTIGVKDEDSTDDWEERLWAVARAHYLQYSDDGSNYGINADTVSQCSLSEKNAHNVVSELDEQSIEDQERLYLINYETEQKGVLAFRTILLQCIETYVNVFHHQVGTSERSCNKEDEPQRFFADDKPTTVHHYVPFSTARALFLEVITMADPNNSDNPTSDVNKKAEVVMEVLVDDVLNIFRRYQVVTTLQASLTKVNGTRKRHKCLGKGVTKCNDAQAELEEFLYGDMIRDVDGQDDVDNPDEVLETREIEIRMRHNVVKAILNKSSENGSVMDLYWANTVMSKVVLSDSNSNPQKQTSQTAHRKLQVVSSSNITGNLARLAETVVHKDTAQRRVVPVLSTMLAIATHSFFAGSYCSTELSQLLSSTSQLSSS